MKGYDHLRHDTELLLDLLFLEGSGAATADFAKAHHVVALTGTPAWANLGNDLTYLSFDPANPDYLSCAAANSGDVNFIAGDFSGAAWFNPDVTGNRYVFNKGTAATGWAFYEDTDSCMRLNTRQGGPALQSTVGATLTLDTWQLVGFARTGAAARVYLNGRDVTTTAGTHVAPATAAAQNLYIGCTDGAGAGWLDGYLWRPRIWGRYVSVEEMRAIYEAERYLFGL